jgi:integrase
MGQYLTDKVVERVASPAEDSKSTSLIVYDAPHANGRKLWIAGFGVRVTVNGARSFVFNYRSKQDRKERRYTIGSYPTWSTEAARKEAQALRRRVDEGGDPIKERKAEQNEKTVTSLCEEFLKEHVSKKRPTTRRDYSRIVETVIKPVLGRKLVKAVDVRDIERMHRSVSEHAPIRANRVLAVTSKMLSLAVRWKYRPDNPVRGVERNAERKIRRYLRTDELVRLMQALAEYPDQEAANALRLLLFTGARKNEVLSAMWSQFDLAAGIWTKLAATTKQREDHIVPLSKPALQLLIDMHKRRGDSPYLFPARRGSGHRTDLKVEWPRIVKAAAITERLRIHDLRHSFASALASTGHGLPVVGALLGHTQPATTHRYAHLYDEVQRQAADSVGSLYAGLVAKRPRKAKPLQVVAGGKR